MAVKIVQKKKKITELYNKADSIEYKRAHAW